MAISSAFGPLRLEPGAEAPPQLARRLVPSVRRRSGSRRGQSRRLLTASGTVSSDPDQGKAALLSGQAAITGNCRIVPATQPAATDTRPPAQGAALPNRRQARAIDRRRLARARPFLLVPSRNGRLDRGTPSASTPALACWPSALQLTAGQREPPLVAIAITRTAPARTRMRYSDRRVPTAADSLFWSLIRSQAAASERAPVGRLTRSRSESRGSDVARHRSALGSSAGRRAHRTLRAHARPSGSARPSRGQLHRAIPGRR
jgi:hypothetical protein